MSVVQDARILKLYLNRVYLVLGLWHQVVSQRYFGKIGPSVTLWNRIAGWNPAKCSKLAPTHDFNAAQSVEIVADNGGRGIHQSDTRMAMAAPPRIVNQVAGGMENLSPILLRDVLNAAGTEI